MITCNFSLIAGWLTQPIGGPILFPQIAESYRGFNF